MDFTNFFWSHQVTCDLGDLCLNFILIDMFCILICRYAFASAGCVFAFKYSKIVISSLIRRLDYKLMLQKLDSYLRFPAISIF